MDNDRGNDSSNSGDGSDFEMITQTTQPSQTQSQTQPSQSQSDTQQSQREDDEPGAQPKAETKARPKEQLDEVPLTISSAVCKDTKASLLAHIRDETLNFAGDTGAIGRIAVESKKKGRGLTFDLKGQQFRGQIVPSATVLVVGVGRTEAKVEGLFSEVCRLDYKGNVLDAMGGEVLKGEMDDSYKFEEEDVNARGAGGDAEGAGDDAGGGGKTPKLGRKKSFGKKKSSSSGPSSSAKKGLSKKARKS
eukprot:g4114.t1